MATLERPEAHRLSTCISSQGELTSLASACSDSVREQGPKSPPAAMSSKRAVLAKLSVDAEKVGQADLEDDGQISYQAIQKREWRAPGGTGGTGGELRVAPET